MKTLVLVSSFEETFFVELEGNHSHLNEVLIGAGDDFNLEEELNNILVDEDGEFIVEKLYEPTKDWDFFISVGIHL